MVSGSVKLSSLNSWFHPLEAPPASGRAFSGFLKKTGDDMTLKDEPQPKDQVAGYAQPPGAVFELLIASRRRKEAPTGAEEGPLSPAE
jgi:hypothetical protein